MADLSYSLYDIKFISIFQVEEGAVATLKSSGMTAKTAPTINERTQNTWICYIGQTDRSAGNGWSDTWHL